MATTRVGSTRNGATDAWERCATPGTTVIQV
jgi:hypothetical protein